MKPPKLDATKESVDSMVELNTKELLAIQDAISMEVKGRIR